MVIKWNKFVLFFTFDEFINSFYCNMCKNLRFKIHKDSFSPKIFKILLIPVVLLGFIIWVIPMNMRFYEFFRAMF